ncbi:MAG TPA: hypothetical protein VK176_11915 [Phycisphaerales bacterium]|nr:hypothetical protein [Phycisphaerales bacterium]
MSGAWSTLLLVVHACATLAMAGLIWFVQIVHYPLMAQVGEACWARYSELHRRKTTLVVAPLMLLEAGAAVVLVIGWWAVPAGTLAKPSSAAWTGLTLLVVAWVSTFAVQVPLHTALGSCYDRRALRLLVRTNWIRTIAWSGRGVIAAWMLGHP